MSDTGCRLIKLTNGDNIIGKIKTISNNVIVLDNPFVYKTMSMFSPMGIKNIILFKKWFELSNESIFELAIDSVLSMTVPNEKILFLYEKEKKRKQSPYISNDELYQNPQLMKMVEEGVGSSDTPKQVPIENNEEDHGKVHGMVNINIKITQELLDQNEGFENLLRAIGIPIDELLEQMEKHQEQDDELEDIEEESEESIEFGNNLDDWSPDPNDYIK